MTSWPGALPTVLPGLLLGLAGAACQAQATDAETLADLQRAVAVLRAENLALAAPLVGALIGLVSGTSCVARRPAGAGRGLPALSKGAST